MTSSALLGRAPSWRGAHPDYGTANTLFKLDNTYIELLAPQGEGMAADIVDGILNARAPCLALVFERAESADDFIPRYARSAGLEVSDPVPGHGVDEQTGAERRWRNMFWDPSAARGIFSFCIEHEAGSTLPEATPRGAGAIAGVDHVVVKRKAPMLRKPSMATSSVSAWRWNRTCPNGAACSSFSGPAP